jgi:biotin transport system substrate-specific component
MLTGCLTGLAIVFFIGVVYYWAISKFWLGNNIETKALLMSCLFLPLPGDILLCVFTSVLGKRVLPVLKRYNKSEA